MRNTARCAWAYRRVAAELALWGVTGSATNGLMTSAPAVNPFRALGFIFWSFGVLGSGFRVSGLGLRVSGLGLWA